MDSFEEFNEGWSQIYDAAADLNINSCLFLPAIFFIFTA